MLKRLAELMVAPLVFGLVLLVLGAIAYRPIEPGPTPEVVLNGEMLMFPRDLHKLDDAEDRLRAEMSGLAERLSLNILLTPSRTLAVSW